MSLKTWKAEFYPVPASRVSKAKAVEDSLHKWKGLLPGALKRHGVWLKDAWVRDQSGDGFIISSDTCALCQQNSSCLECPIRSATMFDCLPTHYEFLHSNRPQPMIGLLTKTLAWQRAQARRRR